MSRGLVNDHARGHRDRDIDEEELIERDRSQVTGGPAERREAPSELGDVWEEPGRRGDDRGDKELDVEDVAHAVAVEISDHTGGGWGGEDEGYFFLDVQHRSGRRCREG